MNSLYPTTLEELFRQDTLDYVKKHLLRYVPYVDLKPNVKEQNLTITLCKVPIEQWELPAPSCAPGAVRVTIQEIRGQLMLRARIMRWNPHITYKDPRLNRQKADCLKTLLDKVTTFMQKNWEPF